MAILPAMLGVATGIVLLWAVAHRRRPTPTLRPRSRPAPDAGRPVTPGPEPTTMTWLAMGGR
jgi:hypothetical protein